MTKYQIDPDDEIVTLTHVHLMRFQEEALAQSARNYAFTKNKKWQKRYETIKPKADNLLRFATAQSKKNKRFFKEMLYTNIKCVEYETRAINLVNQGKQNDAVSLLEGKEYNYFRQIIQSGLQNYVLAKQKKLPKSELNIITTSLNEIFDSEKTLSLTDEEINKEKLKTLGELSARLTHDIKNPLSTIKNITDILESNNQDPSNQKYFTMLRENIGRIIYQIEEVLSFAKPRPLIIKKHSLNSIINDIVNSLHYYNNIQIIVELTESEIECDRAKITIAISNIITNAIQAIGNEVGKIIITSIEEGKNIITKIQNTGPNIPEENVEKIFEPLFTTKQTGTGLGLVSVKNIVEQHNGTITVKNNPVTFIITLPKSPSIDVPKNMPNESRGGGGG